VGSFADPLIAGDFAGDDWNPAQGKWI
jgi:hypothetical protein